MLSARSNYDVPEEGQANDLDQYQGEKHISQHNPLEQGPKHPIVEALAKCGQLKKAEDLPKVDLSQEFLSQKCFRDHLTPFEKGIKIYIKWDAICEIDQMKQLFEKQIQEMGSESNIEEVKELQRKLWAIEGVLKHHFNVDLLKPIYENYRRIDCVPTNFNFFELMEIEPLELKRPKFL